MQGTFFFASADVNESVVSSAGGRRLVPTWRMEEGECRDSLAMEVALQCKLPPAVVARASQLYNVRMAPNPSPDTPPISCWGLLDVLHILRLCCSHSCWESFV